MSEKSYPYAIAHLHCVDLMEEVSKLPDVSPGVMLLLANAASILAKDQTRVLSASEQ
jgi:hypothetical protein